MSSRLHKTSMKLHASLHNNSRPPTPVYLTIRLWAQPSHAPCRLRRHTALIAVHSARARSRVLSDPHGLALPVRALAAHRWPRLDARLDEDPSVPLVLPPRLSKLPGLTGALSTPGSARTRTRASASPSTTTATSASSTTIPASRSFQLLIDLITVLLGYFLDIYVTIRPQTAPGSASPADCRDVGPA